VKIAPRLGIEPITTDEPEECLLADVPQEADIIASLARGKAELEFGNSLAGYSLVTEVIHGYESKADESFSHVAADYRASVKGSTDSYLDRS
jgi:hypothetical protein